MTRIGCLGIAFCTLLVLSAHADPPQGEFEVHDLSLWITDGVAPLANDRAGYASALPPTVSSLRPSRSADDALESAPTGLITFHGQPTNELDVELKATSGTFVAHWPTAEASANRLRWPRGSGYMLVPQPDPVTNFLWASDDHWFQQARLVEALFVRGSRTERFLAYDAELKIASPIVLYGGPDKFTVANRSDETLYDVVVVRNTPQGVRVGWLDELPKTDPKELAAIAASRPAGTAKAQTLATVNLFGLGKPAAKKAPDQAKGEPENKKPADGKPAEGKEGVRLFGLAAPKSEAEGPPGKAAAKSAAAKPDAAKPAGVELFGLKIDQTPTAKGGALAAPATGVELVLSEPRSLDSDDAKAATRGELAARLHKAGLAPAEIELFLKQHASRLFDSTSLIAACRLGPATINKEMPLSIFPVPQKIVRVPLLLARNVDPQLPQEIDELIARLGEPSFARRQEAEEHLTALGPLAFESLKKALQHKDLEIAIRAERILIHHGQQAAGRQGATEAPAAAAVNAAL